MAAAVPCHRLDPPPAVRMAPLVALALTACVHEAATGTGGEQAPAPREVEVQAPPVPGAPLLIEHAGASPALLDDVRAALAEALPRVGLWGDFRHPVVLRILPDHEALEAAAGRVGYPWLRAWARYDEILLQSPDTFGLFEGGSGRLRELLAHELTHCLMYQLVADPEDWQARDRDIPLWFREGMASWTAGQGHRRMSPGAVAEWMAASGRDPLSDSEALYREHMRPVYGAAHHAFARLVATHGEGAVRGILAALRAGLSFDAAFETYTAASRPAFELAVVLELAGRPRALTPSTPDGPPPTGAGAPEDVRRPSAGAGAPPR